MYQKLAIAIPAAEQSKKCFHCGLTNLGAKTRCVRCGYDVWTPLTGSKNNQQTSDYPGEFGRLKASVLIVVAVLLLGMAFLYINQDAQATSGALSEAAIAKPEMQQTVVPEQIIAQEDLQSREASKHVLAGLELFQRATEHNMTFEEYDRSLARLKADLNKTLPTFVDHKPEDETFRREVDAAVRDYTAAGSWWKTAERNSAVLTDADRTERLVANWTSAKTHLDKAEQVLAR